jgi:hypothetical protein
MRLSIIFPVVREILQAEDNSLLKHERNLGGPDLSRVKDRWFSQFLSMALSGVKRDEIDQAFAAVTIINFNYDRSLEQYLYWALQTQAAISQEQAARLVSSLRIMRPYGYVGALDWQDREGVPFGPIDPLGFRLFSLAARIRTYNEQHQSDLPKKITEALNSAQVIIFLGFGYHAQNTELFQETAERDNRFRQVFATAKGIDQENFSLITKQLATWLKAEVTLLDKTSASLMSDLRPSILHAAS